MKFSRTAGAAVVLAAVFTSATSTAIALPPPGGDPIIHCPKGYVPDGDGCRKLPPPPPVNNPVVSLDLARQTVDRGAVHVTGKATDADTSAPLTVRIAVDGTVVKTITANQADPPVATPGFFVAGGVTPSGHSYDVTVPAGGAAQQVCVTAVNVGSGADATTCRAIDRVIEFDGSSISYDFDHLQITDSSLEELDRVTNTNNTNVQQSTTISGQKNVVDTQGWSNSYGVKVTMSGSVGIPLISDFKVSVEGSATWTQNGSTQTSHQFAWSQPVLVPAKSKVEADIAVTKTTLNVPYILTGAYVYASGARVAGTNGGLFTGVNSHDLDITLTQTNLDGTPAAKPVQQPQASLLSER
jgi:hypothetical protein